MISLLIYCRFQEETEEDALIGRLVKQIDDRLDARFTEMKASLDQRFKQLQASIDSGLSMMNEERNFPIGVPPSTPQSIAIPPHRSWSLPDVKRTQAATSRPPHLPVPLRLPSVGASSSSSSSAAGPSQSSASANKRKITDGEANSPVLQTSSSFKRPKRSVSSSSLPGIPTAQNFTAIMKQWELGDLRNNLKPLKDWGPEERQGYLDYDNNVMAANYINVSATYSKRKAVMEVYALLGHEAFMEKYKESTVTSMVEGCQKELRSKREAKDD